MTDRQKFSIPIVAMLVWVVAMLSPSAVLADEASLAKGKELAFERKKGNCLACHIIADGDLAGTIGPPLMMMNKRFPDKAALRAQIWDATTSNPRTVMPPFGRHRILTEDEIDLVVDYLYTL